jgi:hypothetical protein
MNLKKLFTLGIIITFGVSCKKEVCTSTSGIVGEWKLVEELMDPGNGSGTFQPVSSNKKIKFCDDLTFETNGEMCNMTNQTGSTHVGIYNTSTSMIEPQNCTNTAPLGISYSVSADTLIINYPCFEGCAQKYYRI